MKQFFINFGKNTFKGLTIGISFILGIFLVVYASTNISKLNDQKNSGDKLTLSSWNNLVAKVDELIDRVNAGTSNGGGGVGLPTEISAESTSKVNIANAIKGCRGMDGGGWRLPTQEELALFIGIDGATNYLWTRTVSPTNNDYWIYMKLSDGNWNSNFYDSTTSDVIAYRCVR